MSRAKKAAPAAATIVAYKGFEPGYVCRGFRFAIGETYQHDGKVEACSSGFHACEYPLDVLRYYPPAYSVFAIVEQSGQIARHDADTKIASSKIAIKASIDLPGLIKAAIDFTFSRALPIDPASPASATGESGAASATGHSGAASATGYRGAASATGESGAASATGESGAASATGYSGAASATGESGAASATGEHAVACGLGYECRAMAGEFGAIVLVRRDPKDCSTITHIRASKIGENGIKPLTWYSLNEAGEFVEVLP